MTRNATDIQIARARRIAQLARNAATEIGAHADTVTQIANRLIAEVSRELAELESEGDKDDRTA